MNVLHEEKFSMSAANENDYSGIDYLPQQLLNRYFLFYPVEDGYEPISGQFGKLEEGNELYQLTEPEFVEYLWQKGGKCGVAMGYGGLVTVVLHEMKYLWGVFNALGTTCSMYDSEQDKVILFYQVYDTCPPNMDFVNLGEQEVFETLTQSMQCQIIKVLENQPVLSLIAQSHYMELNDPETTELPVRQVHGDKLLRMLSSVANPLPFVKAKYVDGVKIDMEPFIDEYLDKHGIHND